MFAFYSLQENEAAGTDFNQIFLVWNLWNLNFFFSFVLLLENKNEKKEKLFCKKSFKTNMEPVMGRCLNIFFGTKLILFIAKWLLKNFNHKKKYWFWMIDQCLFLRFLSVIFIWYKCKMEFQMYWMKLFVLLS